MPMNVRPPGGSSGGSNLQVSNMNDFRGGLNMSDDLFKLGETESPDMLNLDVHVRGGLVSRGGFTQIPDEIVNSGPLDGFNPDSNYLFSDVFQHKVADGNVVRFVVLASEVDDVMTVSLEVAADPDARYAVGVSGNPSFATVYPGMVPSLSATQMNDLILFFSKRYGIQYLDLNPNANLFQPPTQSGDTLYTQREAIEASVANETWGTSGAIPRAVHSTVWDNRMWVADTREDGVEYRSRIRWSADGDPLTWDENDWIDVDVGEDGDCISAIAVHGEFLVVFKERAIYLIHIDDATLYRRIDLSKAAGASSQHSVVSTPYGLMFWDPRLGLHTWNSETAVPIGTKIQQAIIEGRIPFGGNVSLSWVNDRVWCAVDLDDIRQLLIYDPLTESWTRYQPAIERVHRFDQQLWGVSFVHGRWLEVETQSIGDDFGNGQEAIETYWVSPWFHGSNHVLPKRWRRPRFVLASTSGGQIDVSVRADLNPLNNVRQFMLDLPAHLSVSAWSAMVWGVDPMAAASSEFAELVQGSAIGNFESVQFRIDGPEIPSKWRMDALSVSYIPKVLRS